MAFIDGTVVNIALPAIQNSFGTEFDVLQWVINAYTLMLGALILTGGALGDRWGRRKVFAAGIVLFAVASIACALAPSEYWLIAARIVQGMGAAMLVPQSLAIIAASFPREVRGRAIGTWAAFAALTTAAGPMVGGALIALFSWRAVFWINIPLAALAVILTVAYVPESHGRQSGRLDWLGSVLATAGLALLIYAFTAIPDRGVVDPVVLACSGAGILVLAFFLWVERRSVSAIMPLGLFRSRSFSAANAITLCLYFSLSGLLFLLPYTLIQLHGYSAWQAGAALLPFGIVMALFSSRAGAWGDRFGPRPMLAAGSVFVGISAVVLAWLESGFTVSYWLGYFPSILLLAVGMTICVAPLTTTVMNSVMDSQTGAASGINNAVSRLAGVIAVALVGLAAILVFTQALAGSLSDLELNAGVKQQLMSHANKLAALNIPEGISQAKAAALQNAIADAFRGGYRMGMYISAGSAAIAALVAWLFLSGKGGSGGARR